MVTEFVVIGDLSLDVVVSRSVPSRDRSDTPAAISIGPGGQGANVAVRLARQGAVARLVAPLADDPAGRLLREALQADGVMLAALPAKRSTMVLVLLDETGERTMLSDRQSLDPPHAAEALSDSGWWHCSGYPLLDERTGDSMAQALGARPAAARLSVAGGSVAPDAGLVSTFRARLGVARPDLLVLSAGEADVLVGRPSAGASAAAERLRDLAPVVIVTDAAAGSAAAAGDLRVELPGEELPAPMLDATGSGDAYVAGLLVELARGMSWPPPAPDLRRAMATGNRLGALVARAVGAQARVAGERPAP